eukprot:8629397-Pyramimonas_sp.AAC.1
MGASTTARFGTGQFQVIAAAGFFVAPLEYDDDAVAAFKSIENPTSITIGDLISYGGESPARKTEYARGYVIMRNVDIAQAAMRAKKPQNPIILDIGPVFPARSDREIINEQLKCAKKLANGTSMD